MSSSLEILGADELIGDELVGDDDVEALLAGYEVIGARRAAARRGGHHATHGRGGRGGGRGSYHDALQRAAAAKRAAAGTLLRDTDPTHTNRLILPMTSSGVITTSAAITARPQVKAYRPERLVIGGSPSDFLLDDIKVGNRSQYTQAGSVPAEAFAATAFGVDMMMETVQTAMDFVIQVTFVGAGEGAQFRAVVFGRTVD